MPNICDLSYTLTQEEKIKVREAVKNGTDTLELKDVTIRIENGKASGWWYNPYTEDEVEVELYNL